MTTTFHSETNEPQYEYSYEGADVQLRCQGLVAVAAGPAPALDEHATRSWFELAPISGNRILAGAGRSAPRTMTSAIEAREASWANAIAGLAPIELVESNAAVADCVYALVDPAIRTVELGQTGPGATALILDGCETRLVQSASSEAGLAQSTSFELPAGSTLLLLTHDPAEGEGLISVIQKALVVRSVKGDDLDGLLEYCLELRNSPLSQCESIVALHFERLDGSRIMRSPADLPPFAGEVVHGNAVVADGKSEAGLHLSKHRAKRCRHRLLGTRAEVTDRSRTCVRATRAFEATVQMHQWSRQGTSRGSVGDLSGRAIGRAPR